MRQSRNTKSAAVLAGLAATAAAVIILLLVNAFVAPVLFNKSVSLTSTEGSVDLVGTYQKSDGTGETVTDVALQPKADGSEALKADAGENGSFEVKNIQYNLTYQMKITLSSGATYTGDVLFYKNSNATKYENLYDGIDFGVKNSGDTIQAVFSSSEKGFLTCTKCS